MHLRFAILAWAIASLVPPCAAAAQSRPAPGWVGDFTVLSANVLVGGLSAGAVQKARGGSFRDGFTRGAAGGAGVYAGKRVGAARWAGAGLAGRQVASVGSSVVWNAGRGRDSFEEVALPLGPLRFYVRPRGGGPRVAARVDAVSLASTVYAATRPELEWDVGRSLSAGVMVFRAPEHGLSLGGEPAAGLAYPGNIFLSQPRAVPNRIIEDTFAHERIHTLQADQLFLALGRPLQDAVLARGSVGRALSRWVDVDLAVFGIAALAMTIDDHDGRPWEMEAYQMTEP